MTNDQNPLESPQSPPQPIGAPPQPPPPEGSTPGIPQINPLPQEGGASPPPPSSTTPSQPIPPPPASPQAGSPNVRPSIFKKIIPILIFLLLVGGGAYLVTQVVLPRLNQSETKEEEEVTLTYWGLWEATPIIKSLINDYQTQKPNVTINYQQQSPKDYRERLQSSLAQGSGPDIFRFHNTWVPMLKNELAPVPTTVFDKASFNSTFYPVHQQDLTLGSNIVGIPLMFDGLALYYNKALFTSGGKSPPESWEELRQTAFDLTVKDDSGQITTAGIALGTTSNVDHWPDILGLMMFQNDADPANPVGATSEDALRFYTIFSLSDKVWDDTLPSSVFSFATGKVAMIFAPSWEAHVIKDINPDLDFGIVSVPQLPGTNVTWASYWAEGVSAKSPSQEAAFQFLKFLSEKNNLVKLYTEASKTRLFGEPYPRKDLAESLQSDEFVGPFISQAGTAKSFYMASRTFDNGINDKVIKYYEDAVNAVNQGQDPSSALQTVSQGVTQVLSQYGIVSN